MEEKQQSDTTNTNHEHITDKRTKFHNKTYLHNGILSSHLSQASSIFQSPGQGLQCIPNCVISLVYHKHKKCSLWGHHDIKNILYSGNILYNSIGKFTTLLVSDIPRYIKLYNYIYNIHEINSIIGNMCLGNSSFNSIPFNKNKDIVLKYEHFVLVIGCSALAIIVDKNVFYVFDPHQRNTYGMPDTNGGAIVTKFNSFNQLCLYIAELAKKLHASEYELTPIVLTKYLQNNDNEVQNITNTSDKKRNNLQYIKK